MKFQHERKQLLRKAFVMKEVWLPPSSILAEHGYAELAGSEWHGAHRDRYHTYLVTENQNLLNLTFLQVKAAFMFGEQRTCCP